MILPRRCIKNLQIKNHHYLLPLLHLWLQLLYHQHISKKRIMIPLIMFCQRFVKLRSLKICFPNFPLARRVFPYLQALMVLRMLLVIASRTHLEIPPTPNLFASMMTNSKLSAIADTHVKVVFNKSSICNIRSKTTRARSTTTATTTTNNSNGASVWFPKAHKL